MDHATLTGRWLGRFDYPDARDPVAFEADLIEDDGVLSGQITEGNSFAPAAGSVLAAIVQGERFGAAVSFEKRYLGFAPWDCPSYEGSANASLTRISGRWVFRSDPTWTGRFVMMRKRMARATAPREAEAVT